MFRLNNEEITLNIRQSMKKSRDMNVFYILDEDEGVIKVTIKERLAVETFIVVMTIFLVMTSKIMTRQ